MRKSLLTTIAIVAAFLPLAALATNGVNIPAPTPKTSNTNPTATPKSSLIVSPTTTPRPTLLPIASNTGPTATPTPVPVTSLTKADQAARLANLKERGDSEIDRRLTNLNASLAKINGDTKLTSADKTALDGQLTTEVTGLTQLKATLDAETTLAAARTDVQNIFLEYRVYALMLPKADLVVTADAESTALQALQTYEQLLAKQVSSTNASLVDMQAKLQSASTSLNGFVAGIISLQPSDYNTDHAILVGKRATLVEVRADLLAAQADGQAIRSSLK